MPGNEIDWLALLQEAVAFEKTKGAGEITRVATRLGVSRPYVSRVLHGDFDPVPKQFVARVIDRLYVVARCPATTLPQPRTECRSIALGPAPTHNPLAMRIWKCCQTCPERPAEKNA